MNVIIILLLAFVLVEIAVKVREGNERRKAAYREKEKRNK